MKPALLITAAAALGAPVAGQSTAPQLLRTQTAFDLTVKLPYAETAALFGPEGERPWAGKHWNPQFIYPVPAHDEEGAVFTVQHGPVTAIWVNTLFDLEARHFIYAYFIPGTMVTTIDVRFSPVGRATTQVHVAYRRTALSAEGNEHVTAFTKNDRSAGHNWQQEIDEYLASRKR